MVSFQIEDRLFSENDRFRLMNDRWPVRIVHFGKIVSKIVGKIVSKQITRDCSIIQTSIFGQPKSLTLIRFFLQIPWNIIHGYFKFMLTNVW